MARIRTIKPEFWKHEGLSALPELTHMLAAALLNYADDEGYFNANPALIKAECFPLRDLSRTVPGMIQDLSNEGYLRLGTGPNGRRYGWIVNFREHQTISKPKPSKIKPLGITWDESGTSPGRVRDESTEEQGTGNREQGTGNREQGTGNIPVPQERDRGADDGSVQAVFDHWKQVHQHPKARLDDKRRRVIRNALKAYSEADLCQAVSGYLNSPHHMGQNDRSTRYDDIELLLRDAKHIDAGLRFYREPPDTRHSRLTRENIDRTRDWVPPEMRHADG